MEKEETKNIPEKEEKEEVLEEKASEKKVEKPKQKKSTSRQTKKKEKYVFVGVRKGKFLLGTERGTGVLIDIPEGYDDVKPGEIIEL